MGGDVPTAKGADKLRACNVRSSESVDERCSRGRAMPDRKAAEQEAKIKADTENSRRVCGELLDFKLEQGKHPSAVGNGGGGGRSAGEGAGWRQAGRRG